MQALFDRGLVTFPYGAAWLAELEAELLVFPAGKHDDQVDALSVAGRAYSRYSRPGSTVVAVARERRTVRVPSSDSPLGFVVTEAMVPVDVADDEVAGWVLAHPEAVTSGEASTQRPAGEIKTLLERTRAGVRFAIPLDDLWKAREGERRRHF